MTVLSKNAPISSLGLGPGVHWLKLIVDGDVIACESADPGPITNAHLGEKTGFVEKWGGTAKKIDDSTDDWLAHINKKHVK